MRVSIWNAWALAAGFVTASVLVPPLFGQEAKPAPGAKDKAPHAAAAAPSQGRTIGLQLAIAGLRSKGCEVDVKPANPSCVFKPTTLRVAAEGKASVVLKDVEVRGADRNCAIALTIREEGQPPKTIYRGYRVAAAPKAGGVENFVCYVSSPSKVAAVAAQDSAPVRR